MPDFVAVKGEHVKPAVDQLLASITHDFEAMEKDFAAAPHAQSYETVVERMERIQDPLNYAWGLVSHLGSVKDSTELREAKDAMEPAVVAVVTRLGQSRGVYDTLKILSEGGGLTQAEKRVVSTMLQQMDQGGVGLLGEQQESYNRNALEQAELKTRFSQHVLDATNAFTLELTKEDAEGMPPSMLKLVMPCYFSK
jgi:oligopeptidase A